METDVSTGICGTKEYSLEPSAGGALPSWITFRQRSGDNRLKVDSNSAADPVGIHAFKLTVKLKDTPTVKFVKVLYIKL
jgi:hypothetical protein